MAETCNVETCDRSVLARSLCNTHYSRWRRHGVTELVPRATPAERMWSKIERTPRCWLFTGADNGNGYGHIKWDGAYISAHRAMYLLIIGPIPDDHDVDHLCRNRRCVNPSHLEAVTHAENMRRMSNKLLRDARDSHAVLRGASNYLSCPPAVELAIVAVAGGSE